MQIKKNKGIAKPLLLSAIISTVVLAGAGAGAAYYFSNSSKDVLPEDMDMDTRELISTIDLSSSFSVASALYNSILMDNFMGVDFLVNKLRELEFNENNPNNIGQMSGDDKRKQVDITKYLSPDAIQIIENRIEAITTNLNSDIHEESYRSSLRSLSNILMFYIPKTKEHREIVKDMIAYRAFNQHNDYLISDLRALYGPASALSVCRYLIGLNDYSRVPASDILEYIVRESNKLIRQIPIQMNEKARHYSTADFTEINARTLYDINDINNNIPRYLTFFKNISDVSVLDKQKQKAFETLANNLKKRIEASQNFLFKAKVYYECQATTSTSFGVETRKFNRIIPNVSSLGGLQLNAVETTLSYPIKGCADISKIYLLIPDANQYAAMLNRAKLKMSDDETASVEKDLKILNDIYKGSVGMSLNISSSNVAAVENHLELNPEQGYFIGKDKNTSGLLFNVNLPSFALLKSLDIAPDIEPIFADNIQNVQKRKQAIYKLNVIDDFSKIENELSTLDIDKLNKEAYTYVAARNEKNRDLIKNNNIDLDNINFTEETTMLAENNSPANTESVDAPNNSIDDLNNVLTNIDDNQLTNVLESNNDSVEDNNTIVVASSSDNNDSDNNTIISTEENIADNNIVTENVITDNVITDTSATDNISVETIDTLVASDINQIDNTDNTEVQSDKKLLSPAELRKTAVADLEKQITLDNNDARYELAQRYINGKNGVRRNVNKAKELLEKSVANEHQASRSLLGSLYFTYPKNNAQKKQGVKYIIESANDGVLEAYGNAGKFYLDGIYEKKDTKKAFEYLKLAAENDDRNAQYNLATMYLRGIAPANKDLGKAYTLLTSASKYVPEASFDLAELVEGNELPQAHDESLAEDMYILAAQKGYKKAYRKAGIALLNRNENTKYALNYLKPYMDKKDKEVDEALLNYYIKKKDSQGIVKLLAIAPKEVQDQYPVEMGTILAYGINGTKVNLKKAEELYRLGISQNNPKAFCALGDLFFKVPGAKKDIRAAVGNYTRGAELGDTNCKRALGVIKATEIRYLNIPEATEYFTEVLAQNPNDSVSRSSLGLIQLYGQAIAKNEKDGLDNLDKSNSPTARNIATIYRNDTAQMIKNACSNPTYAFAAGTATKDKNMFAFVALNNLFALNEYMSLGGEATFDTVLSDAKKVCGNATPRILFDAKGFKYNANASGPDGLYQNAMAYFAGNGVEKNYETAYSLMKQAVGAKSKKALNNFGIFNLFGLGTTKFNKEAFGNFIQASSGGNDVATINAAAVKKYGWTMTKPDHNKSIEILTSVVERGNPIATEFLIYGHTFGVVVEKNHNKAFQIAIKEIVNKDFMKTRY